MDTLDIHYRFGIVFTTEYDDDAEYPSGFVEDLAAARTVDGFMFLAARHTETVTVDGVQVWDRQPPVEVMDGWHEAVELSFHATESLVGIRSFEDVVDERWPLPAGPGEYHALVLANGRTAPGPESATVSVERYQFHVWPGPSSEPVTHRSAGFYYPG